MKSRAGLFNQRFLVGFWDFGAPCNLAYNFVCTHACTRAHTHTHTLFWAECPLLSSDSQVCLWPLNCKEHWSRVSMKCCGPLCILAHQPVRYQGHVRPNQAFRLFSLGWTSITKTQSPPWMFQSPVMKLYPQPLFYFTEHTEYTEHTVWIFRLRVHSSQGS